MKLRHIWFHAKALTPSIPLSRVAGSQTDSFNNGCSGRRRGLKPPGYAQQSRMNPAPRQPPSGGFVGIARSLQGRAHRLDARLN